MAEEGRTKRSRFDQAAEPPRKSRFDRRSRSPAVRDSSPNNRQRSPLIVERSVEDSKNDAAAAAAKAAARINASINAKKGVQHVDVPPIRATGSPGAAKSPSQPGAALNDQVYEQDGDYIKDIEVNDLRNRYTLTKGSTQKTIKEKTGADVTTRGNYYPDKSMATAANPPLYLHVTSTTKDGLDRAIKEIEELMKQELPNLIDERRFRRREEAPPPVERDSLGRRKWPEERIPIDLEPIPGFNLRAQVVGAGGSYVKHIQQETRCRVQIKGRGSGFMEQDTGRESDEQMYLHVAGPDPAEVQRAKSLCEELLGAVQAQYQAFKERGPRGGGGGGGDRGGGGYQNHDGVDSYRGAAGGGPGPGYQSRDRQPSNGSYGGGAGGGPANPYAPPSAGYGTNYNNPYTAGAQSPSLEQDPNGAMSPSVSAVDQQAQYAAWAAYYAQNPAADPYAAYGGYACMMQQWMANPAAFAAQQGGGVPQQPGYQAGGQQDGAPPPPPPMEQGQAEGETSSAAGPPPPPPPPGLGATEGYANAAPPGMGAGAMGYNSVPPPPGL